MQIDQQILGRLSKVPKKKYIRKIIEYAIAVSQNPYATDPRLQTAVSQSFPTDLELDSEQTHKLILSLIVVLQASYRVNFDQNAMKMLFSEKIEEELRDVIVDIILDLQEGIKDNQYRLKGQRREYLGVKWVLLLQMANERGRSNNPVVNIEIKMKQQSQLKKTKINFDKDQFKTFYSNLEGIRKRLIKLSDIKIKDQ